jgi:hypothetical protein
MTIVNRVERGSTAPDGALAEVTILLAVSGHAATGT